MCVLQSYLRILHLLEWLMSVVSPLQSHVTVSVLCSCCFLSKSSIVVSPAGTRDRHGRALLMICTWSSVWCNPGCDHVELLRLLLYYTSTLRYQPLIPPPSHCFTALFSPFNFTSCVQQEGSAGVGADGAGGCPQSCSCPRPLLRPQASTGESETGNH